METYPHSVSIKAFRKAIKPLKADLPVDDPKKWYRTQKEHWLGWLAEYEGPGAYGRNTDVKRDAKYAYNHIVEVEMLLWLAKASGVDPKLLEATHNATKEKATLMAKSAIVRKHIPWDRVAFQLWPDPEFHAASWFERKLKRRLFF